MNFRPYKFNSRIFFYVSGSCLLLLSGMFLLSGIVGLIYGERESVYFAYACAIVALIGCLWQSQLSYQYLKKGRQIDSRADVDFDTSFRGFAIRF